jgi:hypothetical protein
VKPHPLGEDLFTNSRIRGTRRLRLPRRQGPLEPAERVCQFQPTFLEGLLLPSRWRHAGVVVSVGEQHLDRKLHVGERDLVAEPEASLVAEVAALETDAQLGDEAAKVARGHTWRSGATGRARPGGDLGRARLHYGGQLVVPVQLLGVLLLTWAPTKVTVPVLKIPRRYPLCSC